MTKKKKKKKKTLFLALSSRTFGSRGITRELLGAVRGPFWATRYINIGSPLCRTPRGVVLLFAVVTSANLSYVVA